MNTIVESRVSGLIEHGAQTRPAPTRRRIAALAAALCGAAAAGDLNFSDPAAVSPMPKGSAGLADRSPGLDALPGFKSPPPGFGAVPFYWWLGDPLTKERLKWELKQMEGMGVSGYQINYAHSDSGGRSYGLTMPSEPALFSEAWWSLTGWFMEQAKRQGAGVSLSDYTLGFGQGWCVDRILREHPEVRGMVLRMGKDGTVAPETVPWSLNPMHPMSGKWYAEAFFGPFERRFPGEGGKGLNFFFSDELGFGVSGRLWSPAFAEEFKKRKGYDITPELPALFKDVGPRTPKVRLDYNDVVVALSEEGFFKPVFDWHQQRGMIMGCDHGGRGRNVVEFGDYFRTQRWNQGPGADQPGLGKNLIKAKVAASIAHLYERPRVWLEGYYGSGWGTTSAGVVDATFANYAMGFNLLGIHGMYYATHGGWWEWAPPDNTFRMPYWKHLRGFMGCVERLSYLLSQGVHRCDVAILYPVAAVEADMGGQEAVKTAFAAGEQLYAKGVDFDFMDFESLARAKVVGPELHVSGEIYRALVLPAMRAARHSTLEKALAFHRAGGVVIGLGALPEASDRAGRDDPEVAALVKALFPKGAAADAFAALPPSRDYTGPGMVQHRKVGPRDLYVLYGAPQGSLCTFRASGRAELWDPWAGATSPLGVRSQAGGYTELALPLTEKEIQLIVFSPGDPVAARAEAATAATRIPVEGDWEFELQPTSDNRFGDFHWPPTPDKVGAEVRQLWYCEGDATNGPWSRVTCSFGPQFRKSLEAPPGKGGTPYAFSWRWGLESDPGHQGYHGLKAELHDDLFALGTPKPNAKHMPDTVRYEAEGRSTFLSTAVLAPHAMPAYALTGALKPSRVWLNGAAVAGDALQLKAGPNPLVLEYDRPGRTYYVVSSQPPKRGAEADGDAFSPAAYWIWHPGGPANGERWFRKAFELDKVPEQARLRITCDNGYSVSLNGQPVGSGGRWEVVQEYDVARMLRAGRNEIAVKASNTGASAGLIAELTAGATRVATDRSWLASKDAAGPVVNAEQVSAFRGSLWYDHPQGPPKLVKADAVEQPAFKPSPLATRWWNSADVLPFDVRPDEPAPVGWYRFVSPPGLRAMTVAARGRVQAWADGQALTPSGNGRLVVAKPAAHPVTVALRIEQERGCYGGAALPEPIRLECGGGSMAPGDWSKNEGLLCYSGGAWYRKSVTLPAAQRAVLNLGDVAASAEVRVNGKPAGIKVAPPWTLDITPFVKAGENRIEVLVCNTLANHYTTVPTGYRGSTASGLLGPVQVEVTER